MINIGGDARDKSYRYKMPRLEIKIQGSGNGIKTVLCNVDSVSKALRIHPSFLIRHFGIDLGAQSRIESQSGKNRGILTGSHSRSKLQDSLSGLIKTHVLCQRCRLPEVLYRFHPTRIKQTCSSCGHIRRLKDTDSKLTMYMCKHPPLALDKASSWTQAKEATISLSEQDQDQDWHGDTSQEAQLARQSAELKIESLISTLLDFNSPKTISAQISQCAARLRESASPLALLKSIEQVALEPGHESVLLRFSHILKALYDEDVVDEETLLRWHESSDTNASCRSRSKQFVDWLKTAEEEE